MIGSNAYPTQLHDILASMLERPLEDRTRPNLPSACSQRIYRKILFLWAKAIKTIVLCSEPHCPRLGEVAEALAFIALDIELCE